MLKTNSISRAINCEYNMENVLLYSLEVQLEKDTTKLLEN